MSGRGMTLSGLAVIGIALGADPALAGGPYFRYYYDQQLPLILDLTQVVVYQDLDAQPPPPPLGPILAAHGMDPAGARPLGAHGWTMAPAPPGVLTEADMEQLVAGLAGEPGLDFATPVFLDGEEGYQVVLHDILLRFLPEVGQANQQEILDASGAGIVLNQEWAGMADAWRLRSVSKNGFETLDAANALAVQPELAWAEPDMLMRWYPDDLPDDFYFPLSWRDLNYKQIGGYTYSGTNNCCTRTASDTQDADMDTAEAWTITTGSSGVKIAVLDDGVDINHEDLNVGAGVDIAENYPFFGGNGTHGDSCDGHGTTVAGVIAGIHDNTVGVTGVAPGCSTVTVRIANSGTSTCDWDTTSSWVVYGLLWAVGNGCNISVNSYHFSSSSSSMAEMFTETHTAGMLHFASTGNECSSSIPFPASDLDVNAVGSVDTDGVISCFSGTGSGLAFVAPGTYIWTTDRSGSLGYSTGDYVAAGGTSYACPAAAGVAALVWSANSTLTADEVTQVMIDTAVDLGSAGYDTTYGYGLVNAHQAVMEANGWLGSDRSFIISEIRTHDPASPDEEEYVELYNKSTSAEALNHVSYAVIGDDASDTDGVIDEFFELSPWFESLDGHDFWTVATDTFTLGTADQTTTLAFENGDNVTHMLLLFGGLSQGCDVDLNDDGVLDYTPWLKVLDSVSILEDSGSTPSSSEWWYAEDTVGPNGLGDAPGHVYRCGTVGGWEIGPSDPAVGDDTPDGSNPSCTDFVWGGLVHDFIEAAGGVVGGFLKVTGGAGSDQYGAKVLGPFADYLCFEMGDFKPGQMADGASVDGTATGTIDGNQGLVITRLHGTIVGAGMELSTEFPNAASSLQDVTLIDDGAVIAEFLGLDHPIIVVGGPILEPPILEFAPKPDELPVPLEMGATFTFAHDVTVTVPGPEGPVTADRVVVRPSADSWYDHLGLVDLIASGTPSFEIAGELVGKLGHAHRALGAARFVIGPDAIGVTQLGDPQGGDGVAVELPEPAAAFAFGLAPMMGQPPDGAFLDWTTCHVDPGGEATFCGTSRVADAGGTLVLSITEHVWTTAAVGIYLEGDLQAEAQVPVPGTLATLLDESAWPTTLDAGVVTELIYTWSGFAPTTIDLPGGQMAVGDEIRVMDGGLAPGGGGSLIASVALTGANLDQITIIDEQRTGPNPCPEDIDGDGTVGILDFLALLAAWGPCPGCAEDIDGDGTAGILDFLALLAAWGPCPT